jgi:hypothetical protein
MQQAELQQDIERFTAVFLERVAQSMTKLEASDRADVSDAALRGNLRYASSALDIASGSLPEVDLLDLLVFIRLSRRVLEEHWIPELYGEEGRDLDEVFQRSEHELWRIADKIMSEGAKRELLGLIDEWRAENPKQVRVEGIRLLDFSERVGELAGERSRKAGGLLSSVKSATQAADQALLLGERALFLVHRMPFVVRLHARLACREILTDAATLLFRDTGPIAEARARGRARVRRAFTSLGSRLLPKRRPRREVWDRESRREGDLG